MCTKTFHPRPTWWLGEFPSEYGNLERIRSLFWVSTHTVCLVFLWEITKRGPISRPVSPWMRGICSFIILSFKILVLLLRNSIKPYSFSLYFHAGDRLFFLPALAQTLSFIFLTLSFKASLNGSSSPLFGMIFLKYCFDWVRISFLMIISLYLGQDIISNDYIFISDYWRHCFLSLPTSWLMTKGAAHILETEKPRHSVSQNQICGRFAGTRSLLCLIKQLKNPELTSCWSIPSSLAQGWESKYVTTCVSLQLPVRMNHGLALESLAELCFNPLVARSWGA